MKISTKDKVWFALRNLEIAVWEDYLFQHNISKENRILYRNSILDSKRLMKEKRKELKQKG